MKPAITILVMLIAHALFGNTYYVSNNGDDSNGGLTPNDTFETLQHASDVVVAGDSVMVSAGEYVGFYHETSGTENSYIVFHAESGVVISQPNGTTNDGINLEGASYIVVEGFTVIGVPRAGIRSVANEHVIIQNNTCSYNGKWGILTGFSESITIRYNTCNYSIDEHGIYHGNSADYPIIHGNICHDNNANGIHMNADASLGGDGIISFATVTRNLIYNNGVAGGSGINCDGVQDSYIANNLLYNNHASGISLYQIDAAEPAHRNVVVNNTILQPDDGRWALNITNGSSDVIVFNNILLSEHAFRGSISADPVALETLICDHNILADRLSADDGETNISLNEWVSFTGLDGSSSVELADALFIDPGVNNYQLSETSPAIDGGLSSIATANAPFVDFENNARPSGGIFDIGAYEYQVGEFINETFQKQIQWSSLSPNDVVLIYSIQGQLVYEGFKSDFKPNNRSEALLFRSKIGNGFLPIGGE
ncbi:MAG: right-handed parallel beta-helix repeat-containing protein [Flavobacteriales bacterium]